jgi:hypothetical protein
VVLGWNTEKLAYFEEDANIPTEEDFIINLKITYQNFNDLFPRRSILPDSERIHHNYFDLAIYSCPRPKFQTLVPKCFSTHTNFNYFSDHYLKVNVCKKNQQNIQVHISQCFIPYIIFFFFLEHRILSCP